MLAQVFTVLTVLPQVRGHLDCFVEHALAKGFSKGVALSFHRMSSSANVSDSISREDWSLADELQCSPVEFDFSKGCQWLGASGAFPEVRPVRHRASSAQGG